MTIPETHHINGGDRNGSTRYSQLPEQNENPFAAFIPSQSIISIPSIILESGVELRNAPIAYKHYGTLSPQGDNAMVICHALTGSADVADWWGPLLGGSGKAFDVTRFFIVCINSLGSPYGSVSPVTNRDGDATKGRYGPEFPLTTIRDDVNVFKLVLDHLGVKQIAAVIGGSMGGMLVLEFAYFGKDYVRTIVPIATSARYSAWGISWGEAQRQSIYSDPKYDDGYYPFDDPPHSGLGAARMCALLTYRSRNSFETRFGRNTPDASRRQKAANGSGQRSVSNEHWAIHNDGHKNAGSPRPSRPTTAVQPGTETLSNGVSAQLSQPQTAQHTAKVLGQTENTPTSLRPNGTQSKGRTPTYFSAQSYLRYQGDKFIHRFDANCYIAITRKLDTHDVSRHRRDTDVDPDVSHDTSEALAQIAQPTLILGIESDGLFTFAEQKELAASIPNARLERIDSPDGHDAFLLEFEQVNGYILSFLQATLPDIMERAPVEQSSINGDADKIGETKSSTFGEAEVEDITAW